MTGMRQIQDGMEPGEEPATGEHEQPEEPGRDPDVAPAEWQAGAGADRRKDDEHALQEDGDETEDRDDHQGRVTLGRASRQTLEQIAERDQPADDEDDPRHRRPGLDEEAIDDEPGLDRDVAVPDHEVLRPEE